MKKILPFIIIMSLLLLLCAGSVSASLNGLEYGVGVDNTTINAGTINNPYAVRDEADLLAVNNYTNITSGHIYFNVTNFIDVSHQINISYDEQYITMNWCEFDVNQSWIIIG